MEKIIFGPQQYLGTLRAMAHCRECRSEQEVSRALRGSGFRA